VGCIAIPRGSLLDLEGPFLDKNKFLSEVRELHMLVEVSELINACLCKVRLNVIETITNPNIGNYVIDV
jgi:hypothetical protein